MAIDPSSVASSAAIEHLRWSLVPEVGPKRFARIVERFGSAQEALGASAAQLSGIDSVGSTLAAAIAKARDEVDLQGEVELAAKHAVRIICRDDEEYPPGLRQMPDAPIVLYVRGRIEAQDAVALAIVGARRCTTYGREQAYRFAYQLASQGVTIVSGLARGIDGEAHKGALSAGGRTLAVLGNGLAQLYPPEHRELADRIAERGALVSELPMATSPDSNNFVPRNRIIAATTLGTLVVEAAKRSGALATARFASEYDREVFALPGRVDAMSSAGTNALIRDQHAKLVTSAEDIFDELGEVGEVLKSSEAPEDKASSPSTLPLNDEERAIFDLLDGRELSIEAIAERAGQSAGKVASTLITLQLKGLARQLPGNLFIKARAS